MPVLIPLNGLWVHLKSGRIYRVTKCKGLYQSSVAEAVDGTATVEYRLARLDELLECFPREDWPESVRPDAVCAEGLDLEFGREYTEFFMKFEPMKTADLARVILAAGALREVPQDPPDLVGEQSVG
jgi:hypothetical protein